MEDLQWMRGELARVQEEIRSKEDQLRDAEAAEDDDRVRDLENELEGLNETRET